MKSSSIASKSGLLGLLVLCCSRLPSSLVLFTTRRPRVRSSKHAQRRESTWLLYPKTKGTVWKTCSKSKTKILSLWSITRWLIKLCAPNCVLALKAPEICGRGMATLSWDHTIELRVSMLFQLMRLRTIKTMEKWPRLYHFTFQIKSEILRLTRGAKTKHSQLTSIRKEKI